MELTALISTTLQVYSYIFQDHQSLYSYILKPETKACAEIYTKLVQSKLTSCLFLYLKRFKKKINIFLYFFILN